MTIDRIEFIMITNRLLEQFQSLLANPEVIRSIFNFCLAYIVYLLGLRAFKVNTLLKSSLDAYMEAIKQIANCNVELSKAYSLYHQCLCEQYENSENPQIEELNKKRDDFTEKQNQSKKNIMASSPILSLFNEHLFEKEEELIKIYSDYLDLTNRYYIKEPVKGNLIPRFMHEVKKSEFKKEYEHHCNSIKIISEDLRILINKAYAEVISGKKDLAKDLKQHRSSSQ